MSIVTTRGTPNRADMVYRDKEKRRANYTCHKVKSSRFTKKNPINSYPDIGNRILKLIDSFYLPEATAKEVKRSLLILLSNIRSELICP